MKYRRINILGAAGAGKSTLAKTLYCELKQQGVANYEFAQERAKIWALDNKPIVGWDQLSVFCQQFEVEREFLKHDAVGIICECPLELNAFYFSQAFPALKPSIDVILAEYNNYFPALNIFCILPDEKFYQSHGRFENYSQVRKTQDKIWQAGILSAKDIQFSWGLSKENQQLVINTICQEIK